METLVILLFGIAHLLGDFYFQSAEMVREKGGNLRTFLLHIAIYILPFLPLVAISGGWWRPFLLFALLFISHALVDWGKERIRIRKDSFSKGLFLFLGDQALHASLILAGVHFLFSFESPEFLGLIRFFQERTGNRILSMTYLVFSLMLVWKPVSILIKKVLDIVQDECDSFRLRELRKQMENAEDSQKEELEREAKKTEGKLAEAGSDSNRIGSIIGMLERTVMLIFGFLGIYDAVGLIIAAKSLARFKQMDEKDFAEKYLVGTFLSLLSVLILVVLWMFLPAMS